MTPGCTPGSICTRWAATLPTTGSGTRPVSPQQQSVVRRAAAAHKKGPSYDTRPRNTRPPLYFCPGLKPGETSRIMFLDQADCNTPGANFGATLDKPTLDFTSVVQ